MGPVKVTLAPIHIEGLENAIYFWQKNPIGETSYRECKQTFYTIGMYTFKDKSE